MQQLNRILSLLAALALVVLAGCGGSSSSSSSSKTTTKKAANVLNYGENYGDVWVKSLDPHILTDTLSINMVSLVQANLVKLDYPSLKIIPDLASSWTTSADHKTWTFKIRPNARFSNGDPVTAQDAVWSITRALLPSTKSPVATTYLGDIVGADAVAKGTTKTLAGAKAVNSKTVQITLVKPIAYFLETLSYPTADVLDKKAMAGVTSATMTNTCSDNVGAGPFEFICLSKGSGKSSFYPSGHSPYMKFKPNPYYYGKKPTIDIYAPFFTTQDELFKAYQAGELDIVLPPPTDYKIAQKMPGYSKEPALVTDYITPNQAIPPFNNVHCRLAVAYAIDRQDITQKILHGLEGPLYDVVPPGLPGYFGKESDVPYYNPARAKQELAQCPGGIHNVTMPYQKTSSDATHEYDVVAANLAAIGANVTLKPLLFNAWLGIVTQSLQATHTQITENLWLDDYPDTQDWADNLLHSGRNYNIGGFNNPQYDKLVDEANVEFNTAKRAALYRQAMKIALNDGAWIGVGYEIVQSVINPRVHGMVNSNAYINALHNDWSNVTVSR